MEESHKLKQQNPRGGISHPDTTVGDNSAQEGAGDDDNSGCHLSTYWMPDAVLELTYLRQWSRTVKGTNIGVWGPRFQPWF